MSLFFFLVCPAAAAPALTLSAEVGFGGWIVPGSYTPLRVEVTARQAVAGTLRVEVPGATRITPPVTHTAVLTLAPGLRQHLAFDVIVQDVRRPLKLSVRSGAVDLATWEVPLQPAQGAEGIVLALTRDPAGLEFLRTFPRKLRPAYLSPAALPVRWQTYEGVVLVVIRDLDPRTLLPAQRQALMEWIAQGGHLLVAPHDGLPIEDAPWLADLLPAAVEAASLPQGAPPVPAVRLRPKPGANVVEAGTLPLAVRWRRGRGIVEVWAFDAFAPAVRTWPGRLRLWAALLNAPATPPIAGEGLAAQLPQTRPLPGTIQLTLAVLSLAYVALMRVALRRWGAVRGGWVGIVATIAVFGAVLYTFAAGARRGATSLAQVAIVEALPDVSRARVTTYVSLLSPYGGGFVLRTPPDAVIRLLSPAAVTMADAERTLTGVAGPGQLAFEVRQVVPFELRARVLDHTMPRVMVRSSTAIHGAILYGRRQLYRLPEVRGSLRLELDPARWEAANRAGMGGDLAERALDWVTRSLDHRGGELWFLGFIKDDRLAASLSGRAGEVVQMLVAPVEVR